MIRLPAGEPSRRSVSFVAYTTIMLVALLASSAEARGLKKSSLGDARKKIGDLIQASGAQAVAVAFHDMASGRELLINPGLSFHAASTMKVPVMMEIYAQTAARTIALDEGIRIK